MKAQFKYAFLSGLNARGGVFAVIFIMNTVFIVLGSLGMLPLAAHITAVSLGGVAIAVMMAANIIGDIAIVRCMFTAPGAYLYALTPSPRWKILLASIITMLVMDLITMAFAISSEVWLSFNLAGDDIWNIVLEAIRANAPHLMYVVWGFLLLVAGYLLIVLIILFCSAAKRSIFYMMPASGILTFLLACACVYVISLLQLALTPFGTIERQGIFIILSLGSKASLPVYVLLTLLEAAGLFVITSKFLEKRVNI